MKINLCIRRGICFCFLTVLIFVLNGCSQICEVCAGSGTVACVDCSDGKTTCSECEGKGVLLCNNCDGEGTKVVKIGNCSFCDGTGSVPISCSKCHGLGEYYDTRGSIGMWTMQRCDVCRGSGKETEKKNALIAKERGKVLNVRLAMQPEKLTAQNAREPKKQYVRFAKEPVK